MAGVKAMSRLREFWRSLEPDDEPLPVYQRLPFTLGVTAVVIVLVVVFIFAFNDDEAATDAPAAPPAAGVAVVAGETAVPPTPSPSPATATPTTAVTATPAPVMPTVSATAVSPTAPPSPTSMPSPTPSTTPAPTLAATPDKITATCVEEAAFFAGPGMRYEQIGTFVAPGESVVVTAVSANGYWMIVAKDGKRGWVTASFFTVDYPLDSLPMSTEIIIMPTPTP